MNLILWMFGLAAGLLLVRNSFIEMHCRKKAHQAQLHSALKLSTSGQKDLYHRLWSGYYVIGRQRGRCDLSIKSQSPDGKPDRKGISRVHCILWYEDGNWYIRPLYHTNRKTGDYYSEVRLNGIPVPEEGLPLEYHDVFQIGESKLKLIHEKEVPV